MLNSQSPLPLYYQLADRLRLDIAAGVYLVNEKIPSEHEFAKRYDIGRPTVRQATDLLVREGILQRKRGSGTFVLPAVQQIDLFSLAGTSTAFSQSELDANIEIISPITLITDSEQIPANLSANSAYYLKRLSCIEGNPVLLEEIYLDGGLFNNFDQQDVDGESLSRIVREVYFLEASSADQAFRIIYPDKINSKLLKISAQTALLHVARTLHFQDYRAAIFCDIYCRTDQFHFSQTIHAFNPQPTSHSIHPAEGAN